jgi:hypothetical protein
MMGANSMAESTKQERLIKAKVARGRSYYIAVGRRLLGYDADTKREVFGPICEWRTEGQEVELPEAEVIRGRELGYLFDPNKVALPAASDGSMITRTDDAYRPGLIEQRMR